MTILIRTRSRYAPVIYTAAACELFQKELMPSFEVMFFLTVLIWFQTNGQCNSFNSIEQLKSRPAHLAAFLHHVISQFDPAPVVRPSSSTLC